MNYLIILKHENMAVIQGIGAREKNKDKSKGKGENQESKEHAVT